MEIACAGIHMTYSLANRPDLLVLDDVSFDAASGEFVSLLGPSGSGKSTLLKIIDGLARPSAGQVTVGGVEVRGPGPDRGFVFQSDSLLPWRTAAENVSLAINFRRNKKHNAGTVGKAEVASIVGNLLSLVGLTGFGDRYPRELSGGMRQRVNLARALAVDPAVLLMDEPFGALDAQMREVMQEELLRIWQDSRKTILFVTHSIEEAVFLSDRILLISPRPGCVAAEVPIEFPRPRPAELRRTPEFAEVARGIWEMAKDGQRQEGRV